MNKVDKQYLNILQRILDEGTLKHTRAGDTLSIFGVNATFDLKEGLPLLTTKKVYHKGILHELIWFLKGDTNIKYLVDNNVNIWNDDAFRWFKTLNFKERGIEDKENVEGFYKLDYRIFNLDDLTDCYFISGVNTSEINFVNQNDVKNIDKETFLSYVRNDCVLVRKLIYKDRVVKENGVYKFGDLGPVYGKQWRRFGISNKDQIQNIIDTLKTNPNDRRMLCTAYNPDVLDDIALPACHMMFQVYARELTHQERFTWLQENSNNKCDEWKTATDAKLNELNVPKHELNLSFYMRSSDSAAGLPYNIASYSMLTYILANICNMTVGKVIYNGGDVHLYCNHIEQAKEQLQRKGSDTLPKFIIKRKLNSIDSISYDDFEIADYISDAPIKYPLNVG